MAEMLGFLKKMLRKRSLRRHASPVPTGLLPLREIKSMTVIMDGEKREFEECKNDIAYFCRIHDIRLKLFIFNLDKVENGERLITSITNTVLRRDLRWRGTFKDEKNHLLLSSAPDLLLILTECAEFPVEYLVKCSRARFKVGRVDFSGQPYDLLISNPAGKACSQSEAFKMVKDIILKIN